MQRSERLLAVLVVLATTWKSVSVIATYPDRRFQVWEYRVSHGSLLVRSPKGPQAEKNVDLVFVGVDYMALPRVLRGVALDHGTDEDRSSVVAAIGDVDTNQVYVLHSEGHRHLVVAVAWDIFDSPF